MDGWMDCDGNVTTRQDTTRHGPVTDRLNQGKVGLCLKEVWKVPKQETVEEAIDEMLTILSGYSKRIISGNVA